MRRTCSCNARWRSATFPELDPVIHAPARLRLICLLEALPPADELTFARLQELLSLSPGNLSTHLRKLEEMGYVAVAKAFRDRTPVTTVSLTPQGRAAHADYGAAITHYLDGSVARTLLLPEEPS